jgi:hypothetical protein
VTTGCELDVQLSLNLGRVGGHVTPYPRRIKNKTGTKRESSSQRVARSGVPAAMPSASPDELQRMKDELRLVNQRLSKIGRVTRPGSDAAKHPPLPEKQDLLTQKAELERKIRASSRST